VQNLQPWRADPAEGLHLWGGCGSPTPQPMQRTLQPCRLPSAPTTGAHPPPLPSPPHSQVVLTLAAVAFTGMAVTGGALGGPGAIILGGGLALSTTAVGMQVRPGLGRCLLTRRAG